MFDGDFIVPIVFFVSVATVLILRGPVGRALAERIAGRRAGASEADASVALHGELEEVRRRLSEVEERLDFTERLLARHGDAERLPPG